MSIDQNIPTVSVIIPLYNKARVISGTLGSVLSQSFQDFEIIIIDDGSTDGGDQIAADLDPRVNVVRQANAGPGAARNRGLAMARGELVTFLDADDEWLPGFLERAIQALRDYPQCGAFTAAFMVEPQGFNRWESLGFNEGPWALSPSMSRHEIFSCLFSFHSVTAVYRRSVAIDAGGHHEERCTFGEDIPFWMRVLLRHPIYRHLHPLGIYNTAYSELGLGKRAVAPIEPVLLDPGIVRASCPPELNRVLELWLAKHACRAAFVQISAGNPSAAEDLIERFPNINRLRLDYIKLKLKLISAKILISRNYLNI